MKIKKYEDEQERIKRKEFQATLEKETEEREKEAKENKLNLCLENSSIAYARNWQGDCKIQKENFPYDYKEDENGSCLLSKEKAERIENTHKERKNECYKRFGN